MRLLRTVVRSEGITALVATHDTALIDVADAVLELADGQLMPWLTRLADPAGKQAGRRYWQPPGRAARA